MGSRLVLVCGLPGSGKTTVAERVAREIRAVRLCPDDWMRELAVDLFDQPARARIEALQWRVAQDLLAVGTNVVVEWGFWTRAERDTLRDGGRRLGAAVELRFLDEPVDVLWTRIEDRGREEAWGSRAITREELDEWAEAFEAPDPEELRLYDPPDR
jgi:predicted kinase